MMKLHASQMGVIRENEPDKMGCALCQSRERCGWGDEVAEKGLASLQPIGTHCILIKAVENVRVRSF
jgi:hypothetical protein